MKSMYNQLRKFFTVIYDFYAIFILLLVLYYTKDCSYLVIIVT